MKKLVVLLAVLSVLFAACRTETTIDTASTAPPTTEAADAVDEATDDAEPTAPPIATAAPTETPTETPTEAPASSSAADAPDPASLQAVIDADDWCEAAAIVESDMSAVDEIDFTDPVALEQAFTQVVAVVSAAQRLAPPEIAADVAQSVQAFTTIIAALEAAEWSFLDLDLSVIDRFDAPMQLATYNIEKYNFDVCGIGTDPGDPPTADELSPELGDGFELEGSIRDQAVLGFIESGFTEAEANCLLDRLDITDPQAMADTTALLSIFTECGLSFDRLAELGGG